MSGITVLNIAEEKISLRLVVDIVVDVVVVVEISQNNQKEKAYSNN